METYFLGAYWRDRKESAADCARRVKQCLAKFSDCDPSFSHWFEKGKSRRDALTAPVALEDEPLTKLLLRNHPNAASPQSSYEPLGFQLAVWNGGQNDESASFSAICGCHAKNTALWNNCVVNLPSEGPASERLLKVEALLRLMRAVVETFDPDWATVMPDSLLQTVKFVPNKPVPGWLFYYASRVSRQPLLPAAVRIVNVASRGNIVIVAEEPLSTRRTEHLQAHAALQAAIAPALQF
jgi:hypothetical protein